MTKHKQSLFARLALSLLAVAGMNTGPAVAQGSSGLEEVVVTAQRRIENLQDVPISINAFNAEQLGRAQVNQLRDLAVIAPSINFSGSQIASNNNISMRGIGAFAPQALIQPAVSLVIDGVQISRQVEIDAVLMDVDSVQALSGPQGTLFGSNTVGGVVNITTKQPTDTFEAYLESSYTTDNEFFIRGMASGPLTDRARARAVVFSRDLEPYITNLYPGHKDQGGEKAHGGSVKFDIDVSAAVSLQLRGDFGKSDSDPPGKLTAHENPAVIAATGSGDPVLGRRIIDDKSLVASATPFSLIESWGLAADLKWDINDTLKLVSISSYRDFSWDSALPGDHLPYTPNNPPPGIPLLQGSFYTDTDIDGGRGGRYAHEQIANTIQYFTQELRLEYSSDTIEALVGLFYNHNDEFFWASIPRWELNGNAITEQKRYGDGGFRSRAIFGDVTWHINDAFRLFAGARYAEEEVLIDYKRLEYRAVGGRWTIMGDQVYIDRTLAPTVNVAYDMSYKPDAEWTGRFGGVWSINPDLNIYASVARGFSGAGINTSGSAFAANAFVDPTTGVAYEVGIKSTWLDNRVRFNAAIYQTSIKDIQLFRADPILGTQVLVSVGGLDAKGLEATLTTLLGDRLTLSGSVSAMDTEINGNTRSGCFITQTVAQGCRTIDGVANQQNLDGKPAFATPHTKFAISGTYDLPLASMPFDSYAMVSYAWQSKRWLTLVYDPLYHFQDGYGLLDMTIGFTDKDGRYEVSLFGQNILNQEYISGMTAGANGRGVKGIYDRGAFSYFGVKGRVNF